MHSTVVDLMFKKSHNVNCLIQNRIQKFGKWAERLSSHRIQCTVNAAIGLVLCELQASVKLAVSG